ncbi:MAG: efflux RND transporter periplasmic adaptor subunit, partial [Planctomycetota bacterium]|nr:efflux RND transporter periplasmic adaptor subunit [Planctomycetota bacterium]
RLAQDELEVQRELERTGANGVRQVELAEGALEEARARLAGLRAEAAVADARVLETGAKRARAERDFELRLDDRLGLSVAEAKVSHTTAESSHARAKLEDAELRLARMEVRAPVDGVVLERLTLPGMVLSVSLAGHEVCSLYDPEQLRVRVDVPQPEVGRIFVGQRAEVECEARRRRPYAGEVIRVVQRANLSKVTLEVHVRILDPDELARPEMLAQVRFFGSEGSAGAAEASNAAETSTVMILASLVEAGAVWVVGPGARAERRAVELGATHGELVEVLAGLNLTDKLVDSGRAALSEGDGLRIQGGAR